MSDFIWDYSLFRHGCDWVCLFRVDHLVLLVDRVVVEGRVVDDGDVRGAGDVADAVVNWWCGGGDSVGFDVVVALRFD